MRSIVAIRREDLSKLGEKRTAIVPDLARQIVDMGYPLLVQPAVHPQSGNLKRAFSDEEYLQVGAQIQEDISSAKVIFGVKEVDMEFLMPGKTYFMFSHTHKGQIKNRKLLQSLIEKKCSLVDYELIVDANKRRILTAFTFFAGYAGMIDSLWTLGKKLRMRGIPNAFEHIPQSIEKEDLAEIKSIIRAVGTQISQSGTPPGLPPVICCFLGNGKTSSGAQQIYDLLPAKTISLSELTDIYLHGSRKQVYKLVWDIPDMYRLLEHSVYANKSLSYQELFDLYLREPQEFESNLDQVFPFCTLLMNCIIWSPKYPRLLTIEDTHHWYKTHKTLQVVGDISCDSEGAIQFSRETWIDNPVFIYQPEKRESRLGFEGEGIAVMAVTNLPCEFSADASSRFSENLGPLVPDILAADFDAEGPEEAGLPEAICGAAILWKGQLTPNFEYMSDFV